MRRFIVISACAALAAGSARGHLDQPTARDLVREAVATLSREALGAERVDWAALEAKLVAKLPTDATPAQARALIGEAVAALNDRHARYAPPPEPAPAPPPKANTSDAVPAPAAAPVRSIPALPEGRMLGGGVAYIVAPGCNAPDVDGLRRYARAAADVVARLHKERPRGWIIDLRLNGGGNIWPMLLGFRPLLRDGVVSTMVRGGTVQSSFGVDGERAWMGSLAAPSTQLAWGAGEPPAPAPIDAPVAVLLGPWTMSSGEGLAIALRVRPRVRFFGEATGGLTTVTNGYPLADGSLLILPVASMGDAQGRAVDGALTPDEPVALGDWPTADDAAARAAAAWISGAALPADATPKREP